MQIAKLLNSQGLHITFVNTEFNHRRLVRSNGPDFATGLRDFRFERIPDGIAESDMDATQDITALSDSVRKNCLVLFRELLMKLKFESGLVPAVICVIYDGLMSFAIEVAEELGVVNVHFWTASAVGLIGFLQFDELAKRGIVPFKDDNFINDGTLDMRLDWVTGIKNLQIKDLATMIRTTDPNDIMLRFTIHGSKNSFKADAIIFNTFDEIEFEVLDQISLMFPREHIYSIGPLSLLESQMSISPTTSLKSNLWKEDINCFNWLEKQNPNSVLYLNFGSITVMMNEQFIEFAWGLVNSRHPFLWIIRPDIVMGNSTSLPQEFYEKIKNRGNITTWCPQNKVLSHKSIGAFLTHTGWNSTMESISNGVPMLCWPFFDEQLSNCLYACGHWGIGLEISHDASREEVEGLVKEMMDGEKGKVMKRKALQWKRKAKECGKVGGS